MVSAAWSGEKELCWVEHDPVRRGERKDSCPQLCMYQWHISRTILPGDFITSREGRAGFWCFTDLLEMLTQG